MRIIFFIGTLCIGGKERRLIELLSYLKENTDYHILIVLRRNEIEFPSFYKLNIKFKILTKVYKKGDLTLPFKFYKICKEYRPDIVHTWGSVPAFISHMAVSLLKIPHINSQITDAPPDIKKFGIRNLKNVLNFHFSTLILANSYAGLKAYNAENKRSKVIYNGINLNRFKNLQTKEKVKLNYGIKTVYSVIMVASFSDNKDYDRFILLAKEISLIRNDVTFIAVGSGIHLDRIKKVVNNENITNIVFAGKTDNVESLINVADIGMLLSPKGEGISNAILEYMALEKPVIANDAGGTNEIIKNGITGLLITNETIKQIAALIDNLLDDKEKRQKMGKASRTLIEKSFTLDRMGKEFVMVYENITVLS